MKKILVPTDFSTKSLNALRLAKDIAEKNGAHVDVVHVIEDVSKGSFSAMGEVVEDPMDSIYMIEMIKQAKSKLKELEADIDFGKIGFETHEVVGNPYEVIMEKIKTHDFDLVVIGARGISDIEELFIGSLTDKLVRTAPCPVLSVKDQSPENAIKKIAFASDLKGNYTNLVNRLKELQHIENAEIHLVKINTPADYKNDRKNKKALRKFADKYGLENYYPHVFNYEETEYGIVYFAESILADMIAMGVSHKTGIQRLISGGHIAEDVAQHSYRPVWTYKVKDK